jgi:hypothetical protein
VKDEDILRLPAGGDVLEPVDAAFPEPPGGLPPANGIVPLDDHLRETLRRHGDTLGLQEIADPLGVPRKALWER